MENGVPLLNGKAVVHRDAERNVQTPMGIPQAFSIRAESLPGGVSYRVSEQSGAAGFADNRPEIEVPDGSVFLIGDNRDSAKDSRIFGPVPIESLESRLTFIGWSDDRSRIGKQVQPGG
jgi:signal peptidase I